MDSYTLYICILNDYLYMSFIKMIYIYLTDMIALREPESRIAYAMTIVLCIQYVRLRKSIRHLSRTG